MNEDAAETMELDEVELVSSTYPLDLVVPRPNHGHLELTDHELWFDLVITPQHMRALTCPLVVIRDVRIGEWARSGGLLKRGRRHEPTATGGLAVVTDTGTIEFRVPLGQDELVQRAAPLLRFVAFRKTHVDEADWNTIAARAVTEHELAQAASAEHASSEARSERATMVRDAVVDRVGWPRVVRAFVDSALLLRTTDGDAVAQRALERSGYNATRRTLFSAGG